MGFDRTRAPLLQSSLDCCSRRAPYTVGDEEEGVKTAGTKNSAGTNNSAWIRRHLSDSIYLWAVGEKADDDDDDIKLSDRLIGWLILFVSARYKGTGTF